MAGPVHRGFWDWVTILGVALTALLAGFFVLVALLGNMATGAWASWIGDDDDV